MPASIASSFSRCGQMIPALGAEGLLARAQQASQACARGTASALRHAERALTNAFLRRLSVISLLAVVAPCFTLSAALLDEGGWPFTACVCVGASASAVLCLLAPNGGGFCCSVLLAATHVAARGPLGLALRQAAIALGAALAFVYREQRAQDSVQGQLFRGSHHDASFQEVDRVLATCPQSPRTDELGRAMLLCVLEEFGVHRDVRWRDAPFGQRGKGGGWFEPLGASSSRDCLCAAALEVFSNESKGPLNALRASELVGRALLRRTACTRAATLGEGPARSATFCRLLLRLGDAPAGSLDYGETVRGLQAGLLRIFTLIPRWHSLLRGAVEPACAEALQARAMGAGNLTALLSQVFQGCLAAAPACAGAAKGARLGIFLEEGLGMEPLLARAVAATFYSTEEAVPNELDALFIKRLLVQADVLASKSPKQVRGLCPHPREPLGPKDVARCMAALFGGEAPTSEASQQVKVRETLRRDRSKRTAQTRA